MPQYLEDYQIGEALDHQVGRTILDTDNVWFTLLTHNNNPIHFDARYASQTMFGRKLVDSTFTLALVTGLTVSDFSCRAINLGWDSVKLVAPVYEGDTLYARTVIKGVRESVSHPSQGIITGYTEGFKYEGENSISTVISFIRTIMVPKQLGKG